MKVLLSVARWGSRGTAQEWRRDKSLLLTNYSVAKTPWNLDEDMKYSQNSLCQCVILVSCLLQKEHGGTQSTSFLERGRRFFCLRRN